MGYRRGMRGIAGTAPDPAVPATGLLVQLRADRGITLDGSGNVQSWAPVVGPDAFTQATAAQRPTIVPSALAGRSVVQFDTSVNASMALATPADAAYSVAAPTVLLVARCRVFSGSVLTVTNGGATFGVVYGLFADASTTADGRVYTGGGTTAEELTGLDWNNWHVVTYQPSLRKVWLDGQMVHDGTDAAISYPSASAIQFGAFTGSVAEFVLYDHLQTTADRQAAEGALAARWGLRLAP